MWGVGRLQVHGICSRRLVYMEVNWGSIKLKEIFSSGDLEIPFVLIGPEVKGLKPD